MNSWKISVLLFALVFTAFGADLKYVPFEQIHARWSSSSLTELQAAAEKGDAQAQHFLARGYAEGRWGQRDLAAAVKWYELAAAQGFPNSQANLGAILATGSPVVRRDLPRGLRLLRTAAETGEPIILFALGNALAENQNFAEALEIHEKAAALKHTDSMIAIGDLYYYGKLARDNTKAYDWYKEAADAGNYQAMGRLYRLLSSAHEDFPARPEEAEEWRKKSWALYNEQQARARPSTNSPIRVHPDTEKFRRAQRLEAGVGGPRDLAGALKLYLELADPYPDVAMHAARIMESAAGPERNEARAMELYLSVNSRSPRNAQAAQAGILRIIAAGRGMGTSAENLERLSKVQMISDPRSHFLMGQIFDRAEAVALDMPKAVAHYRTAMRWGSVEAMNRLGELWVEGVNGESDSKEAARWFQAAAISGFPPAQYNIGMAFANGFGVQQNKITAFKWLTFAARSKEKRAENALAALTFTAAERAEIDKLKAAIVKSPEEIFLWLEDLAPK